VVAERDIPRFDDAALHQNAVMSGVLSGWTKVDTVPGTRAELRLLIEWYQHLYRGSEVVKMLDR
jgi:hypothetical protein